MKKEELDSIPEDWKPIKLPEDWKPIKGFPKQSRRWQVTVNLACLPESLQADVVSDDPARWERCEAWLGVMIPKRRWVASLEEGDKEHKRHLQMAVADDSPVPQRYLLEHLGRPHVEPMRESPAANMVYCSKGDTHLAGPWTMGDWDALMKKRPGRRMDVLDLRDRILDLDDDNINEDTIVDCDDVAITALRSPAMVDRLFTQRRRRLQERRKAHRRECLWMWGETGTGKSKEVNDLMDSGVLGSTYVSTAGVHPFDGYKAEETVFLEEFRGSGMSISEMLALTDAYSRVTMPARYADKPMLHERVIVTSNVPPSVVYGGLDRATRDAMLRRWTVLEKQGMNDHPLYKRFGVTPPPILSDEEITRISLACNLSV